MSRFTHFENYKFDKLIFRSYIILMLFYVFLILWLNDFDIKPKFYFECKEEVCTNPLYKAQYKATGISKLEYIHNDISDRKYITRGEYGQKPPFYITYSWGLATIGLIIAFIINHILHNKGVKFDWGDHY